MAAFGFIDGVKAGIVRFPHHPIAEIERLDGIKGYADADIAPMRIEAILHRAKKKDFFDLELLIRVHGLHAILAWHRKKSPDNSIAISIPYSITHFKDAKDSEAPSACRARPGRR